MVGVRRSDLQKYSDTGGRIIWIRKIRDTCHEKIRLIAVLQLKSSGKLSLELSKVLQFSLDASSLPCCLKSYLLESAENEASMKCAVSIASVPNYWQAPDFSLMSQPIRFFFIPWVCLWMMLEQWEQMINKVIKYCSLSHSWAEMR